MNNAQGRDTDPTGGKFVPAVDALLQNQEQLRALNDAFPMPMMVVDGDDVIVGANALAHEALAVDVGRLAGHHVAEFGTPGDEGMARLVAELKSGGTLRRIELRTMRADGRSTWVIASAQPYSVHGSTHSLVTFQDISELKRKEQALTDAYQEAERTIRARMRFLAAASHDLRQPLQALALFSSVLDHHVTTDKGRGILQSMKTSLRGMEEMFDSLMDMSKLDAGVMKAEPQVFLLNDIFEHLETVYVPQAQAVGLQLTIVPSSSVVRSDPRIITRNIGNFLSNAIRYTRTGHILLGARRRGSFLLLSVLDSGPGIADNQRLEIFREFHRGDQSIDCARGAGMGLGLAIVLRLAALLNHRLDVRSIVGRGSCFSIEVPLAEEWCSLPDRTEIEVPPPPEIGGAIVVVVDDDPSIQASLKMILSDWGCRAVVVDNPMEALDILQRDHLRPDVILADLHLREADAGLNAINAIRTACGSDTPAFLFTGDTEAMNIPTPIPILRKPLDPMRLRILLATALERQG